MSSKASDSLEQLDLFDPLEYTLGLDLGIKSIGWAILSGERIAQAGVYLFETAEEISNGRLVSKAAERGRKRRIRRMLNRKARRGRHIRYLLQREGLPTDALENRILPHMKQGKGYYDACQQKGLPEAGAAPAGDRVPPFDEMYNPVVNRALSQSRKLINAVIDQYGMPTMIRVELARDLGRGREEWGKIESDQRRLRK